MTKMEIEKKIEDIETLRFLLAMKDHWNRDDFEWDAKKAHELRELRKELAKLN